MNPKVAPEVLMITYRSDTSDTTIVYRHSKLYKQLDLHMPPSGGACLYASLVSLASVVSLASLAYLASLVSLVFLFSFVLYVFA